MNDDLMKTQFFGDGKRREGEEFNVKRDVEVEKHTSRE
jgi:hypothetical protein